MALASGTYRIHSAYRNDGRYVQNNNGLLQLELLDNNANSQKFQVTLTANGSYSIYPLNAGAGSGIAQTEPQNIGPAGVQALIVIGNNNMRWNIQQYPGSDPNAMTIITVPPNRQMLWNRVDPDGQGRLQLMNAGQPDPHNRWNFDAV
jgi:hypothetical protein